MPRVNSSRIGRGLRAIRIQTNLTQQVVATRAGVPRAVVARVERGDLGRVRVEQRVAVASVLRADIDILLRWEGSDLDRLPTPADRARARVGPGHGGHVGRRRRELDESPQAERARQRPARGVPVRRSRGSRLAAPTVRPAPGAVLPLRCSRGGPYGSSVIAATCPGDLRSGPRTVRDGRTRSGVIPNAQVTGST